MRDEGVTTRMYHFVVAEDIVPPALFTEYTKERIHLFDCILKKAIKTGLGSDNTEDEDSNLSREVIEELKRIGPVKDETPVFYGEHALNRYAPIGTHFYIKGNKVYEMKHDDDPQYIARALIDALKALDNVRVPLPLPGRTSLAKENIKEVVKHHKLLNYERKLTELGIVE